MILRRVLVFLVFGLAVLTVAFGVLMAFYALLGALGDVAAARTLLWVGVGCLMLIVVDIVLLVGFLGLRALEEHDRSGQP